MTTLSQLKELSNEELRVTVAAQLGWKFVPKKLRGQRQYKSPSGAWRTSPPDFLNDLNAMAEAEKTLSDEEHWKFRSTLWDLTDDPKGLPSDGERHNRDYCQSDARLRAIAFVFVRGA